MRITIKNLIIKYFLRINDIRIFAYNVCSCKILIKRSYLKKGGKLLCQKKIIQSKF